MVLPSPNSLLLIGIVTSFATIRRSEAGSSRHEKLFWGSCIQNERLSSLYGLSIRECITECQLRPACRSINYDIRVRRCDINDVDANLEMIRCSKFIYSRKSDWFEDPSELCQPVCTEGERCNRKTRRCEVTECGPPPIVNNTIVRGNRRFINNRLLYICKANPSITYSVVCQDTGAWNPVPHCPTEESSYCGEPESVPNSSILPGNNFEGDTRQYQCDTQYEPHPDSDVSSMIITCQSSGQWTTSNFICSASCGDPPLYPSSTVSSGSTLHGSSRQYECIPDHVTTPDSDVTSMTITCQSTGAWTATNFQCVIDCGTPSLPSSMSGVTITAGDTWLGSSASIKCQTGYQPMDSEVSDVTITCLETGEWSQIATTFNCLIDCGEPPAYPNSNLLDGSTTLGSTRHYHCIDNHVTNTDSGINILIIYCNPLGVWTTANFQCVIDCGTPASIQGVVIPTGNTWLGSSLVIQCQTGYQPENNDVSSIAITCLETGDWSEIPTTFNCLIDCGAPSSITGVDIPAGDTVLGSSKTIQCQSGYQPENSDVSSEVITCLQTGDWSQVPATFNCLIDCGAPSSITGVDIPAGDTVLGSSRIIQCQSGYQAENSEVSSVVITCLETGDWSQVPTTFNCLIDCGAPSSITGVDIPAGDTVLGSSRTIQCQSGYQAENSEVSSVVITCLDSGDWSQVPATFNCLIDCGPAPNIYRSYWTGTTTPGSVVTYICYTGYIPSPTGASTTITCQSSGAWTTSAFTCEDATLGGDCNTASDCLEENSRCLYNNHDPTPRTKCLCNYNAEYNQTTGQCDIKCDQFSTTFTKIENIYINKYNLADYSDKSKDECQQLCIDFGNTCVEFDYWKDDNKCFLGSTTYQQILDADPTQIKSWNEFDLYTRNCAT